jgi:hypothetical protein
MLLEPTVESDDRFALLIHERYEVKDGKVADQVHVYRYVGQRLAMATINAVCDDQADAEAYHKVGQDVLLSINGPGVKTKPGKSATRGATTRPAGK